MLSDWSCVKCLHADTVVLVPSAVHEPFSCFSQILQLQSHLLYVKMCKWFIAKIQCVLQDFSSHLMLGVRYVWAF